MKTANLIAGAIDDFIKINKNNNLFNGPEITYEVVDSNWTGVTVKNFDSRNNKIRYSYISFNMAKDWKKLEKIYKPNITTIIPPETIPKQ